MGKAKRFGILPIFGMLKFDDGELIDLEVVWIEVVGLGWDKGQVVTYKTTLLLRN